MAYRIYWNFFTQLFIAIQQILYERMAKNKIYITIITNKRNLKQIKSKFSKFKTDENQNFKIIFIPNMLFIYK